MSGFNRRQMIGKGMLLLGGAPLSKTLAASLYDVKPVGSPDESSMLGPPSDLLSTAYSPTILSQSLASRAVWHPYASADERAFWMVLPDDIRSLAIRRAEALLGTAWVSLPASVFLEFKRSGNRSHYESLNFARRGRLQDLVLAECMEGKGRFLDEIVNGIWLTCDEAFWGIPAHLSLQKAGVGLPDISEPVVDLFAAQTSQMLAWIHYLLGKQLDMVSPLVTRRIEAEAKRRILDPALERDDFWWMFKSKRKNAGRLNNWTAWIDSNWLVTNLLLEADPARRLKATSKICRSLDDYLEDFSPDGACEEGASYWAASPGCYFDCLTMLASATGKDQGLFANPFVRTMMRYVVDVHVADDYAINYGDAHAVGRPPGELAYRMGRATKDEVLRSFGANFLTPPVDETGKVYPDTGSAAGSLTRPLADLHVIAEARRARKADALKRVSWHPALCLMTTRATEGRKEGFYLAVQAAQNSRNHGHNDSGSFIVFHDGLPVFIDVGPEAYTAKTFGSERYSLWMNQSAYHNLPTVGGIMQSAKEARYRATECRFRDGEGSTGLAMNLATAYPDEAGIVSWQRDISLDRRFPGIRLVESFELRRKVPVALSFMTPRTPVLGQPGSIVFRPGEKGAKDVTLKFDPSVVTATMEPIALKDEELQHNWGRVIYRVLLTSNSQTNGGQWKIDIA